ncbi:MAG: DUF1837 domain-containing protein [Thermoguttaceae bacterium]
MLESSDQVNPDTLRSIAFAGTYTGLAARLRQIDFDWTTDGVYAEGTFCYLSFRDGQPTQNEFVDFIYGRIIDFCLPREKVRRAREAVARGDTKPMVDLTDEARSLFIHAKKKNPRSGEPGELVLFTLLEGIVKAPRLVAKMRLKTNANMEVHGSDAIHIKYDAASETLTLYWGEAKLYGELPAALDQIATSIKGFREYNPHTNGVQREFDIHLVQSHPDLDGSEAPATRNALIAYFDPYTEYSNQIKEVHACLAIWDWEFYATLNSLEPDQAEKAFKEKYREQIKSACSLFIHKIKSQGLDKFRFHFFLIPIVDVKEFRKRFCEKVGLPFNADSEEV